MPKLISVLSDLYCRSIFCLPHRSKFSDFLIYVRSPSFRRCLKCLIYRVIGLKLIHLNDTLVSIIISRNLCLINQFLDHHVHLKIWVRWPCIPEFLAYQSILDRMIYSKKTIKEWKYIKSKLQNLYKIHKCQWIKQTENWCSWRISDKLIWPRNLKKTSDAPGKR